MNLFFYILSSWFSLAVVLIVNHQLLMNRTRLCSILVLGFGSLFFCCIQPLYIFSFFFKQIFCLLVLTSINSLFVLCFTVSVMNPKPKGSSSDPKTCLNMHWALLNRHLQTSDAEFCGDDTGIVFFFFLLSNKFNLGHICAVVMEQCNSASSLQTNLKFQFAQTLRECGSLIFETKFEDLLT